MATIKLSSFYREPALIRDGLVVFVSAYWYNSDTICYFQGSYWRKLFEMEESLVEKTTKQLPYLLVILLGFYWLPLLIVDTGSAMMLLLVIIPLICFLCSCVYGARHSFNFFYAMIVAVLFIPSIFIFYNTTAWVYSLGYGIISLIGNLVGALFYRSAK